MRANRIQAHTQTRGGKGRRVASGSTRGWRLHKLACRACFLGASVLVLGRTRDPRTPQGIPRVHEQEIKIGCLH